MWECRPDRCAYPRQVVAVDPGVPETCARSQLPWRKRSRRRDSIAFSARSCSRSSSSSMTRATADHSRCRSRCRRSARFAVLIMRTSKRQSSGDSPSGVMMPYSMISNTSCDSRPMVWQASTRVRLVVYSLCISCLPVCARIECGLVGQFLPQTIRVAVGFLRHHDLQHRKEVALTRSGSQPAALDAQTLTCLAVRCHCQADPAGERRHIEFGAQCGFPRRQGNRNGQIAACDVEQRMRHETDTQIEITGRAIAETRPALTLETNTFAIGHAGRNLHLQGLANIRQAPGVTVM